MICAQNRRCTFQCVKNRLTKYEYKGMLTLELQITQTIRPRFRQGDDGKSLPSWHEYVDSMVIQR